MSCAEVIEFAFGNLREPTQALMLPDRMELIKSPCQYLVGVALMPHVPNDLIPSYVEGAVYSYSKFNNSQIGRQMSAVFRYNRDIF